MKLSIIIPIRNREKDLYRLINNLIPILKFQNIQYKFYIVYQQNNKLFNKGYLNNIGYLFSQKENFSDNYLFNDVNVFPLNKSVFNYNFNYENNNIYNPYGYTTCIARFFCTNSNTYRTINGYSNNYNGWGFEDVDLLWRCNTNNVLINRKNFVNRDNYLNGLYKNKFYYDNYGTKYEREKKMKIANNTTKRVFMGKWISKLFTTTENQINDGISNIDLDKINFKIENVSVYITKLYVY